MNRLVDVVVTDGFTGNVALKTIEGSARAILSALGRRSMSSAKTKLGGLLLRRTCRSSRTRSTPRSSAARCSSA